MNIKPYRLLIVSLFILIALVSCSPKTVTETVVEQVVVTRTVTETIVQEGEPVEIVREATVVEDVAMETEFVEESATDQEAMPEAIAAIPQVPAVVQSVETMANPDDDNSGFPLNTTGAEMNPEEEMPPEMFFESYGVNPFIQSAEDSLSTFAIDVDTGAYTIMRRHLNDGFLPPPASVRVEEFVNYFEQEYAPPVDEAFAIHLEGAPSPYDDGNEYQLVRVGIQGYEVAPEDRPDAMLIFVIDVSGSMDQSNRLGLVKESLALLTEQLRPTDRVGIVVYGSEARVVLNPTPIAEGAAILRAIDDLRTEGSTNAAEGIRVAYLMAERFAEPGQINRLILASDGVANVGATTAETILEYAQEGISLSTFGFGMGNYNDVLMEQLADQGDGTYAYIDSIDEAERVFMEDLTGTLLTIAKDAKIQVEFNPAVVEKYRLIGYENRDVADADFRNDSVDAGEIGAGHSVTALYEIKFVKGANPAQVAMTVRVRYADPDTAEVEEIARSIGPNNFAETFNTASARFQLNAVVVEYAELLRDSYWAQENSLDNIVVDTLRIREYFPQDEDVQEFADLVLMATALSR